LRIKPPFADKMARRGSSPPSLINKQILSPQPVTPVIRLPLGSDIRMVSAPDITGTGDFSVVKLRAGLSFLVARPIITAAIPMTISEVKRITIPFISLNLSMIILPFLILSFVFTFGAF